MVLCRNCHTKTNHNRKEWFFICSLNRAFDELNIKTDEDYNKLLNINIKLDKIIQIENEK